MYRYLKNYFLLFTTILLTAPPSAYSQKRSIDNNSYKTWERLNVNEPYNISNNGDWAYYQYGSIASSNTIVLNSLNGAYLKIFKQAQSPCFSEDSKYFLCKLNGDSIAILDLKKKQLHYQKDVGEFSVSRCDDDSFLISKTERTLKIIQLGSNKEHLYSGVENFVINTTGMEIAMQLSGKIILLDLKNFNEQVVFHGTNVFGFLFDKSGVNLGFIAACKDTSIYVYNRFSKEKRIVVSNKASSIPAGFSIDLDDPPIFSPSGQFLYFRLQQMPEKFVKNSTSISNDVLIFHYLDRKIKSSNGFEDRIEKPLAVVNINDPNNINVLEAVDSVKMISDIGNKYALMKTITQVKEAHWNPREIPKYFLIDISNREKLEFVPTHHKPTSVEFSPKQNFVSWIDTTNNQLYVYSITAKKIVNISLKIKLINRDKNIENVTDLMAPSLWLGNENAVLIKDKYDLWQVDPNGVKSPINVTNGFGRKNGIQFSIALDYPDRYLTNDEKIILVAFNERTKDNGFWTTKIGTSEKLIYKTMDPCLYSWPIEASPAKLLKARDAETYLVSRQTVSCSQNVYTTNDLKQYRVLSDIHPEKNYNWLSSRLITYPMPDGSRGQAILYTPDDFDTTKKYPVIFHYYEERSRKLHYFMVPGISGSQRLDIPWYVSNGYIVCEPDIIHSGFGNPSKTATNSVESAARFLCQFSWVDSKHLGLQGHSFGGYETHWIIANSNMFAAAQSSAGGGVDMFSAYGNIRFGGNPLTFYHERGQGRLGAPPWKSPLVYFENSALFKVDKITTPILLQHGKDDGSLYWQGLEFYNALRRAGKVAWWIVYPKSGHILGGKDADDFTVRQQQFFDYYLKGKPMPKWMRDGSLSLELDSGSLGPLNN